MSRLDKLILVTEDLKEQVKKSYNKTDNDIREDLDILYTWLEKQPHLPHFKDNGHDERLLMRNKFRVEQTKKKLDAYYTLKGLYREFFTPDCLDSTSKTIQNSLKCYYAIPLKTPTPSGERIFFFKIKDVSAVEHFFALELFQYYFMIFEMLNKHDYCTSIRFIGDVADFSLHYVKKMDPNVIIKGMKLFQEGFSCRLSAIDYVNAPGYMDIMIKLFGPLIKDGKIKTYSSFDELDAVVPRELLPNEYGGKAGKLDDLRDAWIKEIEVNKEYLQERINLMSDEKKRIGESNYNDLFGTEGTFKKLNLD